MSSPLPWKLVKNGLHMEIHDARGIAIMSNERYYPWNPDDPEDWEMIVAAVNAPQHRDEHADQG